MKRTLETNQKIKESLIATRNKRKFQECKVFTFKIQSNKLNSKQKENLKMLFVEAKWIRNDVLSWSEIEENKPWEYKLSKYINILDKNKNKIQKELKYLGVQVKQSIIAEIITNIRTLHTLKTRGHKVGKLKYKSNCTSINLKQYKNTHKIIGNNRFHIQSVGKIKVSRIRSNTQ